MIYQLTIYYGAVLNGKAIYSIEQNLINCKKLMSKEFDDTELKKALMSAIEKDGLDATLFDYRFLTKEEYENKIKSKTRFFEFS